MAKMDGISLEEWLNSFPDDQKTEILSLAEKDIAEFGTVLKFRKIKDCVRESLETEAALERTEVRKIEKQTDLLLSTFRKVVESTGGKFRVLVELPDHNTYDVLKLRDDYEDLEGTPLGPFYEEEDINEISEVEGTTIEKGTERMVNEKVAA